MHLLSLMLVLPVLNEHGKAGGLAEALTADGAGDSDGTLLVLLETLGVGHTGGLLGLGGTHVSYFKSV